MQPTPLSNFIQNMPKRRRIIYGISPCRRCTPYSRRQLFVNFNSFLSQVRTTPFPHIWNCFAPSNAKTGNIIQPKLLCSTSICTDIVVNSNYFTLSLLEHNQLLVTIFTTLCLQISLAPSCRIIFRSCCLISKLLLLCHGIPVLIHNSCTH